MWTAPHQVGAGRGWGRWGHDEVTRDPLGWSELRRPAVVSSGTCWSLGLQRGALRTPGGLSLRQGGTLSSFSGAERVGSSGSGPAQVT